MSLIESMLEAYQFNRGRTLATIDRIEQLDPGVLVWRPGKGRAHVGWQLMHIAITEDLFASERLNPTKPGLFSELWERFRGGSTPDDNVPSTAEIRDVLDKSRESLVDTVKSITEADLETIPDALAARGLTVRNALHIISWHEAHHQGQIHLTLNLFENRTN